MLQIVPDCNYHCCLSNTTKHKLLPVKYRHNTTTSTSLCYSIMKSRITAVNVSISTTLNNTQPTAILWLFYLQNLIKANRKHKNCKFTKCFVQYPRVNIHWLRYVDLPITFQYSWLRNQQSRDMSSASLQTDTWPHRQTSIKLTSDVTRCCWQDAETRTLLVLMLM